MLIIKFILFNFSAQILSINTYYNNSYYDNYSIGYHSFSQFVCRASTGVIGTSRIGNCMTQNKCKDRSISIVKQPYISYSNCYCTKQSPNNKQRCLSYLYHRIQMPQCPRYSNYQCSHQRIILFL